MRCGDHEGSRIALELKEWPFRLEPEHDLSDRFQLGHVGKAVLRDDRNVPEMPLKRIGLTNPRRANDLMDVLHCSRRGLYRIR